MSDVHQPVLSIVMPVHDTGPILLDSVRSVIAQSLFALEGEAYWELLIVDDASSDPATLAALNQAAALSKSIRVIANQRARGAAGARNMGIFAARGLWIGFLDSDDLWFPDFLQRQRDAFASRTEARWRAAHFQTGDAAATARQLPLSERSPCLYRHIEGSYRAGEVATLSRPVDVLLRCGCIQVMTVQLPTTLIRSLGGFDESLDCAEDYDLWLRVAQTEDLHMAPIDAGIYRIRSGSLTRSGRPMYYGEDRMLLAARAKDGFAAYRADIDARLRMVYTKFCFDYRAQRRFGDAMRFAIRLIRAKPSSAEGWRQLAASMLRR